MAHVLIDRNLYRPVQPTVNQRGNNVTYREFVPAEALQPYVYCYWRLKTSKPLQTSFPYRVVADGCIDIIIDLDNADDSIVMGFHNSFSEFNLQSEFNYIGIRFLPAMFPFAFRLDAAELKNKVLPLNDVVPEVGSFITNNFGSELNVHRIIRELDRYLTSELSFSNRSIDHRFFNALNYILFRKGALRIEHDIDTGLSSRQMRRVFDLYIGDSPKTFSKVIRFQNILSAKPSVQSLRRNKLFYDAGYYDQAHFIKEFQKLYGATPSRVFES